MAGRTFKPEEAGALEPVSISHRPSLLQTKGNRIVNGTAEIVRLKGLMIPDPARLAGERRYARTLFETVRTTGAKVIRIPVHPQFWARDPDYIGHYLDPAVRWAGDAGLRAELQDQIDSTTKLAAIGRADVGRRPRS